MRALEVILWWLWKGLLAVMVVILCLVAALDVQSNVGKGLIAFFALSCFLLLVCTELDA